MLIAWLTLHWGILPRLDNWRPQIESRVGAALGAPLRIGAIRVRSGSWVPAFEIDDVRVLDARGEVALHLGRVTAALSPTTLLALSPRFAQLHLDGVQLDVRRDAAGRVFVAGLDLAGGREPADPALADWFFRQPEFVIRHGTLRWTDEQRAAPPLQLTDVDLVLRNGWHRHELRLDATPPPEWGARLALRGRFSQPPAARAGDWQRWSGALYADLPLADLAQLRQHVQLPFELSQGRGALRTWVEIDRGRPVQATADLALTAVALRLEPGLEPLALAQLHGRLSGRRSADGLELRLEQLRFLTDDDVPWQPTNARLQLQQAPAAAAAGDEPAGIAGGSLSIDRLELGPLARVATRLPLPEALRRVLGEMAPEGSVQGLQLSWRGPAQAPTAYQARATAQGVALAAGAAGPPGFGRAQTAGRPGLRGVDLHVEANERGGRATVALKDGAITFPGIFERPELALSQLDAALAWQIQPGATADAPPAFELSVREARFAGPEVRGSFAGRWRTGPGGGGNDTRRLPGHLELTGRIDAGAATQVARYLPLGVPERARRYVERAVGPGRLSDADFEVRGDLAHFPFADGTPGRFRVSAAVNDLTLAYLPGEPGEVSPWPAMTGVAGRLEFDGGAMRIRDARATLGGAVLSGVDGGIAELMAPVLRMRGQARGPAPAMLAFVNATPVGGWIGGALQDTRATGAAELALDLTIPFADTNATRFEGSVTLPDNDVRLQAGTPQLGRVQARIDFSERGLKLAGAKAQALGGEVSIEGGTQADGQLRFSAQGRASAEALLRAGDVPALAPLAALGPRLRGQAAYQLQLGFVQGQPELLLTSDLAGLALALPAPLDKPAAAAWPLRVQAARAPGSADAARLQLDLADVLHARYERGGAPAWRGALGVGVAAPPLPATGVTARVQLPALDADAWRALNDEAAPAGTAGVAAAWPDHLVLRTGELLLAGRRLTEVSLDLQRQPTVADTQWRARVQSAQVEGVVTYRQPRQADTPGRVSARLSRLAVPDSDSGAVEELLAQAPASVPALDLVIDDFRWRGKALGRLEVEAMNRPAPGRAQQREWQLDRLLLSTGDARLTGQGRWSSGRRMALDFELELADSGKFAERMGAGRALDGGKGRIDGRLSWAGSPLSPDVPSLDGELDITLAEGRFLHAEPGAARLLGVLSLQALPRRLLLDFRDVFQQGFAFDHVTGHVTLQGGVAQTQNLRLVGVQAAVLIEGSTDLRAETQNLRIVVVPEINAGTASLAYAAINPAVGLGTFLAQWLFREPMMAAGTREFRVTGSWSEPQVERVERVAAAPPQPPASEGRPP